MPLPCKTDPAWAEAEIISRGKKKKRIASERRCPSDHRPSPCVQDVCFPREEDLSDAPPAGNAIASRISLRTRLGCVPSLRCFTLQNIVKAFTESVPGSFYCCKLLITK